MQEHKNISIKKTLELLASTQRNQKQNRTESRGTLQINLNKIR